MPSSLQHRVPLLDLSKLNEPDHKMKPIVRAINTPVLMMSSINIYIYIYIYIYVVTHVHVHCLFQELISAADSGGDDGKCSELRFVSFLPSSCVY